MARNQYGHETDVPSRMQRGGDLFSRWLTRAEMLAPPAWHELQMAVFNRYGWRADGTVGYERHDNRGVR